MYDLVDNIHNGIVRLTHELGQITGLSEEEQKKFYELAKGTINANDVVEIVNNIDEK